MSPSCTEYVLVSCSCYNKLPHIPYHKATGIYIVTVLEARCLKSVSLSGNRVVVRTPLASEVLGENLFLFQLLVFHVMIGLCRRIDYNWSVAKVKRWGRITQGRDEHMISGCLEHTVHMRLKRREQAQEIQPWHVSVAHGYQIHSFCSLHGQCGCFLPQQGTTTLTMQGLK